MIRLDPQLKSAIAGMPVLLTENRYKAATHYLIHYMFGGHGNLLNKRSITDLSSLIELACYGDRVAIYNEAEWG
jgi:hypothetical protein